MRDNQNSYPGYNYSYSQKVPSFDLPKYLSAFRERLPTFVLTAFAVAGLVVFAMLQLEPKYKAKTTIHLLRQAEKQLPFEEVTNESVKNSEDLNTQVNLIQSAKILKRVTRRIESEISDPFLAPYRTENPGLDTENIEAIVAENRSIIPSRLSLVVEIEYVHPDPQIAATVANYFHEEISATYSDIRSESMQQAIHDLRNQAADQKKEVERLENEKIRFKEKYKTVSLDQGNDLDREELALLNTSLIEAKSKYDALQARWNHIQEAAASGTLLKDIPLLSTDPNVAALLAKLSTLRIEIAELSQRYRHLHPKMIQATESLKAAENELNTTLQMQVQLLKSQLQQSEKSYTTAQDKVSTKKQELLELQNLSNEYYSLQRDLEINEKLYQQFLNRIQEIDAQAVGQSSKIRIIDPASVPQTPYQPDYKIGILLAVIAGGTAASLLVSGLVFFDTRIKSNGDVEEKIGLPVIGMLNYIKGKNKSLLELSQLAARDPQATETLNSIVAGLRLDPLSASAKVILVTSTIANEGKSYTSSSLASAFQRYGEKTLLINCDLRARESRLQLKSGLGLVPYLNGDVNKLTDCIHYNQHLHCDVLPAGGLDKSPYQLFTSEKFKATLEQLKEKYDRIILDTPPVHLFGDAYSLLPNCDGQIFVVGFGRPKISITSKVVSKLRATNCPIYGCIINGIRDSQAKMYYPEYYRDISSYREYGSGKKRAAGF